MKPGELTLRQWVLWTWAGWLLGVPAITILALAAEAVGIGGVQSMVGAGMGLTVGWLQGRLVKPRTGRTSIWLFVTTIGLTLPFLASDLGITGRSGISYSIAWCVPVGGLISGALQARSLRLDRVRTLSWIIANTVGWSLAASTTFASQHLLQARSIRGVAGLVVYLALLAVGGLLLGLPTGFLLAQRSDPSSK